ncbi:hypothetical protein ACFWCF_20735 [Rhodococcus sp. NPDC060090]|uniref:hypothetical protein n=1 Tax=Rhodococcus sp. NPDC060090 TaxID=3347056 RepID=UPI00365C3A80
MSESLKGRVRDKILRQRGEDGGRPLGDAEGDDPRVMDLHHDLMLLDRAEEDDAVVQALAEKYWVP